MKKILEKQALVDKLQIEIQELQLEQNNKITKQNEKTYINKCVSIGDSDYMIVRSCSHNLLYGDIISMSLGDIYITKHDSVSIMSVRRILTDNDLISLQDKVITRVCEILSVKGDE